MVTDLERKEEFSKIFEEVGKSLDISKYQYDLVVKRYNAVGEYLASADSTLALYKPEILPQGSFMLGTMIRPIHDDDELDIDLVCKFEVKKQEWTQFDLKSSVGNRLRVSGTYGPMMDKEGRRCWTLKYSENESTRFHLDILPALVSVGYNILLEKALSNNQFDKANELAIRITDKETYNYRTEARPELWMKSNPFGYAAWFKERALNNNLVKAQLLRESVRPVPVYTQDKLPLVRVVQILKRHRDIMFEGADDKPISIAITTLAARAYNKENDLMTSLVNVIDSMPSLIEERYDHSRGKYVKWIPNPINGDENFADKWIDSPQKEKNFFTWLKAVKEDIGKASQERSYRIQEALEKPFGKELISKAYSSYGNLKREERESGNLYMAPKTGMLGGVGTVVTNHKFFGNEKC